MQASLKRSNMEKKNQEKQEVSTGMKLCRALGVILVLAAIAYIIKISFVEGFTTETFQALVVLFASAVFAVLIFYSTV